MGQAAGQVGPGGPVGAGAGPAGLLVRVVIGPGGLGGPLCPPCWAGDGPVQQTVAAGPWGRSGAAAVGLSCPGCHGALGGALPLPSHEVLHLLLLSWWHQLLQGESQVVFMLPQFDQ